jgi:TolA-binding protein
MKTTRLIVWISLASCALMAGCTTSRTDSEQLRQLMDRTSALEQQLQQLMGRASALEQRVHALGITNAELQMQVRALQQQPQTPPAPRWNPPQNPLPPSQPPINQAPHLTPLDAK